MGLNVGGIHVLVNKEGTTQQAVAKFVGEFWAKLGAKISTKPALEFKPLTLAKTGELGFVVLTPGVDKNGKSWIPIYDSERYFSDFNLAKALAKNFDTVVWGWYISEVADEARAMKLNGSGEILVEYTEVGDVFQKMDPLPKESVYYDQILTYPTNDVKDLILVSLESIPFRENSEYSGPKV